MINISKLTKELEAAGISVSGCNSNGIVWNKAGVEIQGEANVLAVLSAHDPGPTHEIRISPSQQIILADGEDVALITISGEPNTQVVYTINGVEQTADLDGDGMDTLELTCDTPNTTLLVVAGNVKAVIYAVEVPA